MRRLRDLDQLQAPDQWQEIVTRAPSAGTDEPRSPRRTAYVMRAAAVVFLVALLGIVARSDGRRPNRTPDERAAVPVETTDGSYCGSSPSLLADIGVQSEVSVSDGVLSVRLRNAAQRELQLIDVMLAPLDSAGEILATSRVDMSLAIYDLEPGEELTLSSEPGEQQIGARGCVDGTQLTGSLSVAWLFLLDGQLFTTETTVVEIGPDGSYTA